MSIRYHFRKTGMFPLITCDVCGKTIYVSRKRGGIVEWNEDGDVFFAHKGTCSGRRNRLLYWDDLPIFLVSLSANTGCRLKELRVAEKRHAFWASIGLAASGEVEGSKSNSSAMQVQEKTS